MKYRIKIEELNNGDIQYTPQVYLENANDKMHLTRFVIVQNYPCWVNLTYEHCSATLKYVTINNESFNNSFENEEDAMQLIEEYKRLAFVHNGTKVKTTTYKNL